MLSLPIQLRVKINPEDHSTYDWFAESETEEQFIKSRPSGDDPENKIIRKGFALLRARSQRSSLRIMLLFKHDKLTLAIDEAELL